MAKASTSTTRAKSAPKRPAREPARPVYGAAAARIEKCCGMLHVGDGFGIHLNAKPSAFHLRMMELFFGWTWVPDQPREAS